jgi:hypothetical protein
MSLILEEMRILKQSSRPDPKVSLILLDWGVRESFHLLHYLKTQTVPRDQFEVIVVEYYDHVSEAVRKFESEVDTWLLLQMPKDCYYHKHLMYNAGIISSKGKILMIGDSDAMVRATFVERIITSFERKPHLVYHLDEFRNVRRDFFPFNFPSFEEVLGDGCINNVGGKTKGVLDRTDPIHSRNYGACMCAFRDDIISIGGADEDLTYLGHICGPYDMTFRLMNLGRQLEWENDEYLYHTWHPGTDGTDNYLGPHDGMNMSTTALQALDSGRIYPLVENRAIREARAKNGGGKELGPQLLSLLIDPDYKTAFSRTKLGAAAKKHVASEISKKVVASYKGFNIYRDDGNFYGVPESMGIIDTTRKNWCDDERFIVGKSFNDILEELDLSEARLVELGSNVNICAVGERFAVVPHSLGPIDFRIRKQRENPQILWMDTLAEARSKALSLNAYDHRVRHELAAAAKPSPKEVHESEQLVSLTQQITFLTQRLAQVEADVRSIYSSRIWKTLVKIGGIIDRILKFGQRSKEQDS